MSVSELEQDATCSLFPAIFSTFDGPKTQTRKRWCRCTELVEQRELSPKGMKSFLSSTHFGEVQKGKWRQNWSTSRFSKNIKLHDQKLSYCKT